MNDRGQYGNRSHAVSHRTGAAWTRGRAFIGISDAEMERMYDEAARSYGSGPGYLGRSSSSTSTPGSLSHELTKQEMDDALAAGNRVIEPLRLQRVALIRDWKEEAKLSANQMTQIMDSAVDAARKTEAELSAMIDKVPAHWESLLRNERTIIN